MLKILIFSFLNIRSFELSNGLNVFLIQNKISPIATIVLAFKAGGEYQVPEDAGIFHLVEHMFFKGNKRYENEEEFIERAREIGILYNGLTSHNYVTYYYTLPKDKLKDGLNFVYDAIIGIIFDDKELENERKVVLDEYNRDYSDPISSFYLDISRLFYEEYFYKDDLLGPKWNILRANKSILLNEFKKFYTPWNSYLIISGDIDFDEAEKLVKKIFGKWKGKKFYEKVEKLPPLRTKKYIHINSKEVKNARIFIIFQGPGTLYEREDTYVFDLISSIFSLAHSPFQREFVESGIVNSASFNYYTKPSTGEIYIEFEMEKENIYKAKEKFYEFLNTCDDEKWFPENLIEEAKIVIENKFELETENPQEFALNLAFWLCTADYDYFKNYIEKIKNVEKENIIDLMRKYIKDKNFVFGILEPE